MEGWGQEQDLNPSFKSYLWGQDGTNTVVVETVNPTHIGVVVAISLKCYKVISEISNKSITSGVVTAFSVASFLKS